MDVKFSMRVAAATGMLLAVATTAADTIDTTRYALTAGKEDRKWLLPKAPPAPDDNQPTPARVELGKALFFDPRLSSDGNLSCASCHSPMFGWSDGQPTARGNKSKVLGRASPSLTNVAYNTLQMWDGRKASLEDQAMGPMESTDEMAMDLNLLFKWLNTEPSYQAMFASAYPGKAIDGKSVSQALSSFERTIVSADSPFDRWLRGDAKAMSRQQIVGFRLFSDPNKGNCIACHQAPNFTDGGFHNIGLGSYARANPDPGRYAIKPVASMKGAFKTPTLRDVALTAPYFHDGSAKTLMEVLEHYNTGGAGRADVSPNIKPLHLSRAEMESISAFMQALTTPARPFVLPRLPAN
jgi:cytochrome c peroxidase